MLNLLGWIGSVCFAICAIPQAWETFRKGRAEGVSWIFLILWLVGELCTLIYVLPQKNWPLLLNYIGNLCCLLVIIRYKIKE